jgi:hypothetical protein
MALYYIPVPDAERDGSASKEKSLAERPKSLDGRTIGLLFNSKINADIYLQRIKERIENKFSDVRFVHVAKRSAGLPLAPGEIEQLTQCDAVVNAFGDCGSCSSWSVHDGITLEALGIPQVTVVTKPFAFKVRAEVKSLGLPDLPVQVLPHPIGQRSDSEVRAIADCGFDEIVTALTSAVTEVSTRYSGAVGLISDYTSVAR